MIGNIEIFSSGGATLYKNPSYQTLWVPKHKCDIVNFSGFLFLHFFAFFEPELLQCADRKKWKVGLVYSRRSNHQLLVKMNQIAYSR